MDIHLEENLETLNMHFVAISTELSLINEYINPVFDSDPIVALPSPPHRSSEFLNITQPSYIHI